MPVLGIREFARSVSKVIDTVESDREPVIITRHGRPTVAVLALDADRWQSLAVAAAPQLLSSLRRADAALATGRVETLDDVIAELDAQESQPAARPRRESSARAAARKPAATRAAKSGAAAAGSRVAAGKKRAKAKARSGQRTASAAKSASRSGGAG